MKRESLLLWSLYLIVFLFTLRVAFSETNFVSDRLLEYQQYLLAVADNGDFAFNNGLVASSLITIWLPARIHLLTGIDATLLFRLIPSLVFPLMPVFVYLIARNYYNIKYSLLSSAVVLASSYFTFNNYHSRVDVAWGFAAGLVWALVGKRTKLAVLFAGLLTLSHYGTSFLMLGVLGFVCIALLLQHLFGGKRLGRELRVVIIVFLAMGVFVGGWYYGVSDYTGNVVKGFIQKSVTLESPTLDTPVYLPEVNTVTVEKEPEITGREKLVAEFKRDSEISNFFKIESREGVVQSAFGKTFPYMNIAQRIEFISSWLVVGIISLGLAIGIRFKVLLPIHQYLAIGLYASIVVTIVIPHVSVYYGAVRVYFTALTALAPLFILPVFRFRRFRRPLTVVLVVVVLVYGLSTAGITHSLFGIVK